jgi:hypothetical protein
VIRDETLVSAPQNNAPERDEGIMNTKDKSAPVAWWHRQEWLVPIPDSQRKSFLQRAAADKQIADVEALLRRATKQIRNSRREVQRSRDLAAAV